MKRIVFYSVLTALVPHFVKAQAYTTSVGVRVGGSNGLTIQQRLGKKVSIEGMVTTNFKDQTRVTVLGEIHKKIIQQRFNFYSGVGFYKQWGPNTVVATATNSNQKALETATVTAYEPWGISGVLGLELTMGRFNFSLDFKPSVNVQGTPTVQVDQFGFSMRYVIFR